MDDISLCQSLLFLMTSGVLRISFRERIPTGNDARCRACGECFGFDGFESVAQ
ncbi:hypothetical protein EBU02_11110 [bacterium]|nr:hypothetical protein [bacterium]NBS52931.1 hypothetical protein [Spartobacteria bacterium]